MRQWHKFNKLQSMFCLAFLGLGGGLIGWTIWQQKVTSLQNEEGPAKSSDLSSVPPWSPPKTWGEIRETNHDSRMIFPSDFICLEQVICSWMTRELNFRDDPWIKGYVENIVEALLKSAPQNELSATAKVHRLKCLDPHHPLHFNLKFLAHPVFNAFAYGISRLTLHTGFIFEVQSEDELVAVVAHELGHLLMGHTTEIFKLFYEDVCKNRRGFEIGKLLFQSLSVDHLSASRVKEMQADHLGFLMACSAGWDAHRICEVFFLDPLTRRNTIMLDEGGHSGAMQARLTHPFHGERRAKLKALALRKCFKPGSRTDATTFHLMKVRAEFFWHRSGDDRESHGIQGGGQFTQQNWLREQKSKLQSLSPELRAEGAYGCALLALHQGHLKEALQMIKAEPKLSQHLWGRWLHLEIASKMGAVDPSTWQKTVDEIRERYGERQTAEICLNWWIDQKNPLEAYKWIQATPLGWRSAKAWLFLIDFETKHGNDLEAWLCRIEWLYQSERFKEAWDAFERLMKSTEIKDAKVLKRVEALRRRIKPAADCYLKLSSM